jgi:hypothetical protein
MTMLTMKEIGKNGEKAFHKLGAGIAMELGCEKREACMKKEV